MVKLSKFIVMFYQSNLFNNNLIINVSVIIKMKKKESNCRQLNLNMAMSVKRSAWRNFETDEGNIIMMNCSLLFIHEPKCYSSC